MAIIIALLGWSIKRNALLLMVIFTALSRARLAIAQMRELFNRAMQRPLDAASMTTLARLFFVKAFCAVFCPKLVHFQIVRLYKFLNFGYFAVF